ncbi:hypothetical protein Y032_0737g1944 [Ancylostoma ceylanicum]|uniref:Uncharacterized protein n=1 Tax=Ancylostoma ceylanicum TaxID=53326 RepID=A0A016WFW4_9BILA|nr:hypothetical protein Y032_0737g1944 [Ancylostoma ceylanicum]
MERPRGAFPLKKSRTTKPTTSAVAVQVGSSHFSASSYSKRQVHRSYSRSPSRSSTPPTTSRAETSQPTTIDSRLLDRVWNEVHAETLTPVDLSSLHAPQQFQPHTRPPTVLELILAIAKGRKVNRRFDCETDNDTQAFSVPRSHRHILQLTQLLTLSQSRPRVQPHSSGQHDYVLVDSFLHSDFFQQVLSIFTKKIYVPSSSEVTGVQSQHLHVLAVTQALTARPSLSQATTYLQELTTQGQPTPDVMLTRLWTLHRYAENSVASASLYDSHTIVAYYLFTAIREPYNGESVGLVRINLQ